jgi:hypothetical protein
MDRHGEQFLNLASDGKKTGVDGVKVASIYPGM